ncbi:MAG: hypothetical protein NT007_02535 [Candidatus Kapabacteria bacterium]|nr:hypothetical protein [Candidatus Kapabacteria bacterium]
MKKYLNISMTLLFATILTSSALFSGSFKLLDPQVNFFKAPDEFQVESFAHLQNLTNAEIELGYRLYADAITDGHEISVCFAGLCYTPPTSFPWESPTSMKIAAKGITGDIQYEAKLYPNEAIGTSKFRARFYLLKDSTDFQEYPMNFYIGTTGVLDNDIPQNNIHVTTSMAGDQININLEKISLKVNDYIAIYNINGEKVRSLPVSPGVTQTIYGSGSLPNGIYFIKLDNLNTKPQMLVLNK